MERQTNRRTPLTGATAGAAAGALDTRNQVFAVPAVLGQSGPVDITYWDSWSGALGKAEAEVVNRFNDSQQDVKVNYQLQGKYEETAQKLTAALAAKQAPDAAALSDVLWFKFYLTKVLAPLNDHIATQQVDTADYVDSPFNEGVRDGVSFCMPFARSTPLFCNNRDAFKEIGLEAPPRPRSEVAEIAPSLVRKDGDTVTRSAFAFANGCSCIASFFNGVDWAFGGAYPDPDFKILINQPRPVAASELVRKGVQDGWATITSDSENGPDRDFYNDLTAATRSSTGGLVTTENSAKFEVGAAFPLEEETFGSCMGGADQAVIAGSAPENQEAARRYIAFATLPEITTDWSPNTGYLPVRTSAIESQVMQDFFAANRNYAVALEQLARTRPQDSARVWIPAGDQIIGEGLERIIIDNNPAQGSFEAVDARLAEEAKPVIDAMQAHA